MKLCAIRMRKIYLQHAALLQTKCLWGIIEIPGTSHCFGRAGVRGWFFGRGWSRSTGQHPLISQIIKIQCVLYPIQVSKWVQCEIPTVNTMTLINNCDLTWKCFYLVWFTQFTLKNLGGLHPPWKNWGVATPKNPSLAPCLDIRHWIERIFVAFIPCTWREQQSYHVES